MTRGRILKLALALALVAVPFVYVLSQGPAGDIPSATKTEVTTGTIGQTATLAPAPTLGSGNAQPEIPACTAPAPEQMDAGGIPHHQHGYCRCSCGYPCMTSADCGGVSCDRFISCC